MSLYKASTRIAVLAIFLLAVGCASTKSDLPDKYNADELTAMGEKFLAADDFIQALKFFQWAEAKKTNDPRIHYNLGITHDELSMPAEAFQHLSRAIELSSDYSDAYNALGRYYAKAGDLDQAQINFQKALANPLYETPHLALFNLGLLSEKRGAPDAALQYYEEAVQKFPRYGLAYYRMGEILEAHRLAEQARRAYARAAEFAPNMPEAHLRYGIMSYFLGDMESASYSFNRATKLAPNTPIAEEAQAYLLHMRSAADSGTRTRPSQDPRQIPSRTTAPVDPKPLASTQTPVVEASRQEQSVRQAHPESPPALSPAPSAQTPAAEALPFEVSHPTEVESAVLEESPVKDAPSESMEPFMATPSPETATEDAQAGQWTYIVQVGTYLHARNAEGVRKKLQDKGHEAVVKPFNHQEMGELHVVQLTPLDSRSRARDLASRIREEGFPDAIVVRIPAE